MDLTTVVARPLADAFMQVGVYVAVLVAAFGWLRWRHGSRLVDVLERRRRWAPALGALLGVSPGCAGAILVMPLYARGTVSFGTVIAALVATMGDSSWVIMAADPAMAAKVHGLLFVTGLATGYAVDALGITVPTRGLRSPDGDRARAHGAPPASPPARTAAAAGTPAGTYAARHDAGDRRQVVAQRPAGAVAAALPALSAQAVPTAFWLLTGFGFLVSVPVVFQAVDAARLAAALGGVDPYLSIGVAGTAAAAVLFAFQRGRLADDTLDSASLSEGREPFSAVLRHGARETSFIVVWVGVAYLAWSLLHALTGFDGSQLPLLGWSGVAVGALIGLVPGCAVQIVFTGLYVAGIVPLPTLLANALSQDGDALLPLLALERRSTAVATVITTVPGLVVGGLALLLL